MKVLLTIISIIVLVFSLWAGISGNLGVLFVGGAGFLFLLFVANLDRIEWFKAGKTGIEAKSREIIKKAESTLNELQLLAKQLATLSLSLVRRSGRFGGYGDEEAEQIKDSILGVLSEIGIEEVDNPQILDEWHRITMFDYSLFLTGGNTIPDNTSPEIMRQWKNLRRDYIDMATPEEIKDFLMKNNFINDELDERIEDYKYYIEHKRHRRPDDWANRKNWGRLQPNN